MEHEVLITEENMNDFMDQDLEGLKALLECEDFNVDTTLEVLPQKKKMIFKFCKCGSILYKTHKSEFRCGQCGCILF